MVHLLTRAASGVLALALAAGCAPIVQVEPLGALDLPPSDETSLVVAADGAVLAELHGGQDRDVVALDEIAGVLQDAVVAVEDGRFWDHGGIDARALGRAFLENARRGEIAQGGSTISQQLAKNLVVGDEPTLDRKLREAVVALHIEARMTKEEILERYLNTVYLGNGAYGVQAAARRYFGVDAADVDLSQAALLAALVRAPGDYDPHAAPDAARRRRNLVLRLMARRAFVSDDDARRAAEAPLGVRAPTTESWRAPYFVAHVLDLLQHDDRFAVLGDQPVTRANAIFRGGLRIETTLDPDWQRAAEQAVAQTLEHPEDPSGALVAIDPATGAVRALVGGRDYDDPEDPSARFNLAVQGRRQPGSAFKPLVLAAALSEGHTLAQRFPGGSAVTIPVAGQQPWQVSNYADRDFGALSLREGTVHSVNVVYARLAAGLGAQRIAAAAHDLGIRRSLPAHLSLALGAVEVSPLELATVQATLAAGGVYRQPRAIRRITAPDGTVLYERPPPPGKRVLDEAVAWLVTQTLEDVVARGTGQRAFLQRPTAGKTGTTQDWADAWFAGYTPHLAAAIWVGYPQSRVSMVPPRTRIRVEGGTWPAEIFARFGLAALSATPAEDFPLPESEVVRVRVDTSRDCRPNEFTPPSLIDERAYLSGTQPTEVCREPRSAPAVDIPDVVGMTAADAVARLEESGLTATRIPEFSASLPPGYVLRQDPVAGEGHTGGYRVQLWVSSGDRTRASVPDVLGEPLERSRRTLEAAGFVVDARVGCPDGGQNCPGARLRSGHVWEMSPDAGARVPVHSTIILRVYP